MGVILEFEGVPSGYVMILFDEDSAAEIVESLVPGGFDDGFDEMGRSAVSEMGNIMASGLVDGWANALGTEIDISVPLFVNDIAQAVVDPVLITLAERQKFAFTFDTDLESVEREFSCRIYVLPEEEGLKEALDALGPEGGA